MALTLHSLIDYAEHAAGGRLDGRLDPVSIVNQAGHRLVSLAEWPWLNRPRTGLAFVANQNYVALPADFGQLVAHPEVSDTLNKSIQATSQADLLYRRSSNLESLTHYFYTLAYPTQASATAAPVGARLEIWPTPTANTANALYIVYRATWTELDDGTKIANVPADIEPLLIEMVRAYAAGYSDRGTDRRPAFGPEQRVAMLMQTPLVRDLMRRYGMAQPGIGPMRGGIVNDQSPGIYRPYTSITRA